MKRYNGNKVFNTPTVIESSDDDKDIEEMQREVENILIQMKSKTRTSTPKHYEPPPIQFSVNVKVEPVDEPQKAQELTNSCDVPDTNFCIDYLMTASEKSTINPLSASTSKSIDGTPQMVTPGLPKSQISNCSDAIPEAAIQNKDRIHKPKLRTEKVSSKKRKKNKVAIKKPSQSLYKNLKTYTRKFKSLDNDEIKENITLDIDKEVNILNDVNNDTNVSDKGIDIEVPKMDGYLNVKIKEEIVEGNDDDHTNEFVQIGHDVEVKVEPADVDVKEEVNDTNDKVDDTEMDDIKGLLNNVNVKEEVDDEFYEDDIIILNETDVVNIKDIVLCNNGGDDDDDDNGDDDVSESDGSDDYNVNGNAKKTKSKKKYSCKRCYFEGVHKDYRRHLSSECNFTRGLRKVTLIGVDTFMCTKCMMVFTKFTKYLKHFIHHNYKPLTCPECLQTYSDYSKLIPHFYMHIKTLYRSVRIINKDNNTKVMYNQCKKCMTEVKGVESFLHWEKHFELKPRLLSNVASSKDYETKRPELKEIINILLGTSPRIQQEDYRTLTWCNICNRNFKRVNECKRHFIEHLLDDAYQGVGKNKGLLCQVCGQVLDRHLRYKDHMRYHASLPVYKCDICNKTFGDSSNFAKHKKVHIVNLATCHLCGKKFHLKHQLVKHIKMHEYIKPLKCEACGKTFCTESAYKKHIKNIHERLASKFRCNVCKAQFSALKTKWDHMWTEHQIRKIIADCPICQMSFRKFQDVKSHVRLVHKACFSLKKLNTLTDGEKTGNVAHLENVRTY